MNGKPPADFTEGGRNLEDFVSEIHRRDGVIEKAAAEKKWRVIPYEEVARRLQERKK